LTVKAELIPLLVRQKHLVSRVQPRAPELFKAYDCEMNELLSARLDAQKVSDPRAIDLSLQRDHDDEDDDDDDDIEKRDDEEDEEEEDDGYSE
jgi:hypothetical protein